MTREVRIEPLPESAFDAFLALHASTMARKGGGLSLSAAGFRQYLDELSGAGPCRLFSARRPDERVVASRLVLLGPNRRCHFMVAAADEAFLGAPAFLRWKAFEALPAAGCKEAVLTDASLNPATHFKAAYRGACAVLARVSRRVGPRGDDPR